MEYILIAFLVLIGVFLVIVEILILPGVSVAALAATASFVWAITLSYSAKGGGFALIIFIAAFVLTIVALIFSLRAKTLKKIALDKRITSKVAEPTSQKVAIGDRGIAATRMAPMGSVEIGGERYQGRSRGELISPRSAVVVVAIEDNIVVVDMA